MDGNATSQYQRASQTLHCHEPLPMGMLALLVTRLRLLL